MTTDSGKVGQLQMGLFEIIIDNCYGDGKGAVGAGSAKQGP